MSVRSSQSPEPIPMSGRRSRRQKRLETCPGLRMQGLVMPFWAHRKRATSRFGTSARRGVCYREFEGNAISGLIFITLLTEFRKFMVLILLIFSLGYE